MQVHWQARAAVPLFLVAILAACAGDTPLELREDAGEQQASLALAFEELSVAAVREGDGERADALRDAARAARRGIQPSEIEVKIQNETFTYKAIVVGMARPSPAGPEVLGRVLFAWTGERPRTAVLFVASRSDHGVFDHPGEGPQGEAGRARGLWGDLVNAIRWRAKAGSADISVASTGPACPTPTVADTEIHCIRARWDLRVNGVFEPLPDGGETLPIHTSADDVNGVILSRRP